MRVVIAHEWLTSYAGSERVVEQMLQAFPGSPLLTTVTRPDRVPPTLRGARRIAALMGVQLAHCVQLAACAAAAAAPAQCRGAGGIS